MEAIAKLLLKIFGTGQKAKWQVLDSLANTQMAAIAAMTGIIMAAYAAVQVIVDGLVVIAPAEIAIGASWIVPSNLDECITAYVSTMFIKAALDYKAKMVEMYSKSPNFY